MRLKYLLSGIYVLVGMTDSPVEHTVEVGTPVQHGLEWKEAVESGPHRRRWKQDPYLLV